MWMLVLGIAFAIAAWLTIHRFRVGWLQDQADATELDAVIADRRAEAGAEQFGLGEVH